MDDLPKGYSVRAIIDLFEDNSRNETANRLNKTLSKSFAGLSFAERKSNSHPSTDNEAMLHINQRLDGIMKRLKNYRTYDKDTHIAIHEQLVEIVVYLSNLEANGNTMKYRKRELVMDLKGCFRELNDKLPHATEKPPQGFGDSTYKPFITKRSGLLGDFDYKEESSSGYLENLPSPPRISTSPKPESVRFSPDTPNTGATRRLVEEFEIFRKNGDLSTPSSIKKSTSGAVGGKHPLYGIDSALRGTSDVPRKALHRSSSEKLVRNRISSRSSNADQMQGRRRPVSLGGTVVTLSSPQDIISNIKFPQTSEMATSNEEVIDDENLSNPKSKLETENEESFKSVNLLKKYFEINSTENEDGRTKKLCNTKNDQRGDFALYVRNIEKSHNRSSSTEEEESSNDTVFEVEQNDDVRIVLSRSTSIKVAEDEELNSSALRGEVIDDSVVGKSVKPEIEEGDFSDYVDSEE